MARKPSVTSLICLLTSFCVSVIASSFSLHDDFSHFVPACAEQCFLSFILVNYQVSECGRTPPLACLCSLRGASGLTVGEGALQCLTAELSIGFCSDHEVTRKLTKPWN